MTACCRRLPRRQLLLPRLRPLSTAAGVELSWSHLLRAPPEQPQPRDPVIVMHGLLGNKMNWRSLFRAGPLGELDRDVFVADARNHGASPHHSEMHYDAMVDDVLRLLDEQAIDRVVAVGHSMGGKTAMHLALRAPDRVGRLVVCDIAPVV
jgi:pimeloyl-ACP methyl ester carboxylesterase